jgi:hypothetical protein
MKTFAVLTAATALAIAGTVAYAQPASPPAGGPASGGPRGQMTRADFDSLTDARIAGIQAGLKLTADQQRLWGPVEQAMRAMASTRAQRFEEFRQRRSQNERPDLMQRLEQRAAAATKGAENLNALSTSMTPFWASLDDRQKRLLPILMRTGDGGRRGGWRHHGGRGMERSGPPAQQQQPAQPQ